MELGGESGKKGGDIPTPENLSITYFLKLKLDDAAGNLVSDNFYWLSTKPDTMDWKHKKDTVYTPQKDFADLTGLSSLPQVKLEATAKTRDVLTGPDPRNIDLTIKNPRSSVAFMLHLRST